MDRERPRRLSEIKPLPWPDPAREIGAPEVTKSIFREIRELFQRKDKRRKGYGAP
jgi:hypothetical protein